MDDVIGILLRAGLLGKLGDDNERVKRLRNASKTLRSKFLGSHRGWVSSALIAAVDEDTPADCSVLELPEQALLEEWPTLMNAFPDRPVELLRVVILDAVLAATKMDRAVGRAAWYTSRTLVDAGVSAGRWASSIETMFLELANSAREDNEQLWMPMSGSSALKMPPVPSAATPGLSLSAVNQLRGALEPYKANYSGSYQQVAGVVGEHVPAVLEQLAEEAHRVIHEVSASRDTQLKGLVKTLGERLRAALEAQEQAIAAITLRDRLIWWRLSGHSTLLDTRYAELSDPAVVTVAAAFDLHSMVADLAPVAVEHLLVDVLVGSDLGGQKVSISALEAAWSSSGAPGPLQTVATPCTLIEAVAGGSQVSNLPKPMRSKMEAKNSAVFLFRDMQSRRLLLSTLNGTSYPRGDESP